MPDPLTRNLSHLARIDAQLTDRIRTASPAAPGAPSREDLEMLARELPAQREDVIFLLGFPPARLLSEILRGLGPGRRLAIVEPRPSALRSELEKEDLAEFLNHPQLRLFAGTGETALLRWVSGVLQEAESLSVGVLACPWVLREQSDVCNRLVKIMDGAFQERAEGLALQMRHHRTLDANALRNVFVPAHGVKDLENACKGIPVVVVAGGPSLDEALSDLPWARKRAIIICVSRSLSAFAEADFVVAVDPFEASRAVFQGVDIPKETALVFGPDCHPDVVAEYPNARVTFDQTGHPIQSWGRRFLPAKGEFAPGLSVIHAAYDFAVLLGCEPIVLVGADLSFPTDRFHARAGADLGPDHVKRILESGRSVWVPSVTGGSVRTLPSFVAFRAVLQTRIAEAGRPTWNTSPVGAEILGAPYRRLSELLDEERSDLGPMRARIRDVMSRSVKIDPDCERAEVVRLRGELAELGKVCADLDAVCDELLRQEQGSDGWNKLAEQMHRLYTDILQREDLRELLVRSTATGAVELRKLDEEIGAAGDGAEGRSLRVRYSKRLAEIYREAAQFFVDEITSRG